MSDTLSRQKLFEIMRLGPVWEARDNSTQVPIGEPQAAQLEDTAIPLMVITEPLTERELKLCHDAFACIGLSQSDGFEVVSTENQKRDQLLDQIQLKRPKVILVFGSEAVAFLSVGQNVLGESRGALQSVDYEGRQVATVVSEHPGLILKKPLKKRQLWNDLLLIKTLL